MSDGNDRPLAGYEVLLCVTGGIAAYKSAHLVSMLAGAGAGVNVAMTEAAGKFVTGLTFQSLAGRRVYASMWAPPEDFSTARAVRIERGTWCAGSSGASQTSTDPWK